MLCGGDRRLASHARAEAATAPPLLQTAARPAVSLTGMSERVVRVAWLVVGTLLLTGVLVAFGTWRERTASPRPATTPAPAATARVSTPAPEDPRAKPPGYDQSCAASNPWGQPVRAPFICIDTSAATSSPVNHTQILLGGYAGGSFENNVVVEWVVKRADGTRSAPLKVPLAAYRSPEVGAPGAWQLNVGMSETGLPVRVRFTAYFESPKDGSRVAEASVEVELR